MAKGISLLLGFGSPKKGKGGKATEPGDDDAGSDIDAGEDEADDDGEEDKRDAARDLLDAVTAGDAGAVVAAFERLSELCS